MNNTDMNRLKKIKAVMLLAIIGLAVTALISFPIVTHTKYLAAYADSASAIGSYFPCLGSWVDTVANGVATTNLSYPFLFYMSDWLVFAHIAIAIFFIGAYKDPVRNIWIIEAGLICCILVLPLAAIAGEIRGIPYFWRFIDGSFGIVCFVPLWFARKWTKLLEFERMKTS